jgi:hypothetical protein
LKVKKQARIVLLDRYEEESGGGSFTNTAPSSSSKELSILLVPATVVLKCSDKYYITHNNVR